MRVVFAGPSLWCAEADTAGIEMRGPAVSGDILRAVEGGARAIGLIDGFFGHVAAVWHKEILFAISAGVEVYGAASMGALRAAELHTMGMRPVGGIAADYISGVLDDDAAVALNSGPAECGYMPFSEPLVDAFATIAKMRLVDAISDAEASKLRIAASQIFFQQRTAEAIVATAYSDSGERARLLGVYELNRVFRKRGDALELIAAIRGPFSQRAPKAFQKSAFWHLLARPNSQFARP